MPMRSPYRALALGLLLAAVAPAPALAGTPSDAATQIRQIEDSGAFTPPTPQADFIVGTLQRVDRQLHRHEDPRRLPRTTSNCARSSASRARRRR